MRKIILTVILVYCFFLIEFFLFKMGGKWFLPNLLLLLVIYLNLAFGIRYSILAAILAGVLKDSFASGIYGLNIFTFVTCAYMTTVLKRYLHYVGSRRLRLFLVFCLTAAHFLIQLCLRAALTDVGILESLRYVFVPEIVATLLVTSFVFNQLRKCVLRLFV